MFPVASASAIFSSLTSSAGTLIYSTLQTLIVALAALLGLGFGIRHAKRWVTGRKA